MRLINPSERTLELIEGNGGRHCEEEIRAVVFTPIHDAHNSHEFRTRGQFRSLCQETGLRTALIHNRESRLTQDVDGEQLRHCDPDRDDGCRD